MDYQELIERLRKGFGTAAGRATQVSFYHMWCQKAAEAIESLLNALDVADSEVKRTVAERDAALAELAKYRDAPVKPRFECWSTNDGDSWHEHPADAELIYDVLGNNAKVGDEFEVMAGWFSVQARYRIVSEKDDDFEVECISHDFDNIPLIVKPVENK